MNSGAVGAFQTRVYTTRLGSFHQRCFRISMHGSTTLYAIDADITNPPDGGG